MLLPHISFSLLNPLRPAPRGWLRRTCVLALLALATRLPLIAQPAATPAVDSLRRALASSAADTSRVRILDELCWQLNGTDLSAALRYGRQGLALAQRLGDARGAVKCLNDLGTASSYLSDYRVANRYHLQALRLAQRTHDRRGQTFAYNGLANIASQQNDFADARRYFRLALTLASTTYDSALVLTNLGQVQLNSQQYADARTYLMQGVALFTRANEPTGLAFALATLSETLGQLGQPAEGIRHVRRAILLNQQANDQYHLSASYNCLAELERKAGNLPAARAAAGQALALGEQIGSQEIAALAAKALADIASQAGDYRQALRWHQRYTQVHDSLTSAEGRHAMANQRVRYEVAREQEKVQVLTQRLRIQRLEAERERSLILGGVVVALALVVSGGSYWLSRRRLARARREERLRSRIAADLHDDVGTLLTRVSLQAELLQALHPEQQSAFSRLLANSRAAASTMRDVVWSIDAHADTVGALLDRMRDHLDQTASPTGIATELRVSGLDDADRLRPELRQPLYLIFKEAVSNVARHAQAATHLIVRLSRVAGMIELEVVDDGQPVATAVRRSGLGLRSMAQRAADVHGQLETGPLTPRGYRVWLRVAA